MDRNGNIWAGMVEFGSDNKKWEEMGKIGQKWVEMGQNGQGW